VLTAFADIIVELRRLNADDPADRRRVLTGFSRYAQTPPAAAGYSQRGVVAVLAQRRQVICVAIAARPGKNADKVHSLFLGPYPRHTHSIACGRNCAWALPTLWPALRQKRYWYS
jgi:hypothetical protein